MDHKGSSFPFLINLTSYYKLKFYPNELDKLLSTIENYTYQRIIYVNNLLKFFSTSVDK